MRSYSTWGLIKESFIKNRKTAGGSREQEERGRQVGWHVTTFDAAMTHGAKKRREKRGRREERGRGNGKERKEASVCSPCCLRRGVRIVRLWSNCFWRSNFTVSCVQLGSSVRGGGCCGGRPRRSVVITARFFSPRRPTGRPSASCAFFLSSSCSARLTALQSGAICHETNVFFLFLARRIAAVADLAR